MNKQPSKQREPAPLWVPPRRKDEPPDWLDHTGRPRKYR